ncbi:helix-turn-helix domain-containing protein [Roseococcus pinisoli]|uniref:Helix-turn-helix domain-containing protein n=1 Tax=Roseococcus pinisoli TaxID=2835040 RepID=A0ABS5QFM3_9PROT|nr:helix-turn-helix domain-containing protein [Roseococcus pinisoli]MBS7812293.1 helix-turn-helix domain-containing protein [Roseococcus pinisoli]
MELERINPHKAASIMGCTVRTLTYYAVLGKIPGAMKLSGRWTFREQALRDHIAEQEALTQMRAAASISATKQPSAAGLPKCPPPMKSSLKAYTADPTVKVCTDGSGSTVLFGQSAYALWKSNKQKKSATPGQTV